jgi:hypothetical protein
MNEVMAFPPELLTKKLVAYMLSTSEWGVGDLVRKNKLVPVVDGGKWMKFRLEDVRAYVRSLPERIQE